MSVIQAIIKKNEGVISSLRTSFQNKGVNASGRLSSTLKEQTKSFRGFTEGVITAEGYAFNVEQGVSPRETPSFYELRDRITDWVQEKPVSFAVGNQGAINAITAKIKREGTLTYRLLQNTGKGSGAITEVINDELIAEYEKVVADAAADQFVVGIEKVGDRNSEDFKVI